MKFRKRLFGILLVITFLYVDGYRKAGSWLVKNDMMEHADALVILMGSIADRVLQAGDLYKQGLAGKFIIVEESMGAYKALEERGVHIISNTKQVFNAAVALGIPADSITVLPGDATSTLMESIIIREYLSNKPGLDTLLLVSSAPYTRRVSMIFKTVFRKVEDPVFIICIPSNYTNFNDKKWWRSKEGIQTVLMEYVKMANFVLLERRALKSEVGSRK